MDNDAPPLPDDLRPPDDEAARDYERIWAALHRTDDAQAPSYDVDEAWDQLSDRLDLDPDKAEEPRAPSRQADDRSPRAPDRSAATRVRRPALAMAVLALCAVGLGVWWWSQPVSVTTAAGERTTVTLPDGSTVELNGATTLSYARGFRTIPLLGPTRRRVRLDGEAFFSVVESDRAFRVETPNAQVEVLGTKFTVQARADDAPTTTVALESGRVRLRSQSSANREQQGSVVLSEAGQTSRVVANSAPSPPEMIQLKYVQAWREGGFAIADAPLPTVLRELERRFGTTLQLRASPTEMEKMTLHYAENAQLENVLRDICVIQGLTYRETSRGYELIRD
jgi:transmembrane sensor